DPILRKGELIQFPCLYPPLHSFSQSGGISITVRPRLALYMCASITSVSSTSPYLNPPPPRQWMLPIPSRTSSECPSSTARSHSQAHQHSHTSTSSNSSQRSPTIPLRVRRWS